MISRLFCFVLSLTESNTQNHCANYYTIKSCISVCMILRSVCYQHFCLNDDKNVSMLNTWRARSKPMWNSWLTTLPYCFCLTSSILKSYAFSNFQKDLLSDYYINRSMKRKAPLHSTATCCVRCLLILFYLCRIRLCSKVSPQIKRCCQKKIYRPF